VSSEPWVLRGEQTAIRESPVHVHDASRGAALSVVRDDEAGGVVAERAAQRTGGSVESLVDRGERSLAHGRRGGSWRGDAAS